MSRDAIVFIAVFQAKMDSFHTLSPFNSKEEDRYALDIVTRVSRFKKEKYER